MNDCNACDGSGVLDPCTHWASLCTCHKDYKEPSLWEGLGVIIFIVAPFIGLWVWRH